MAMSNAQWFLLIPLLLLQLGTSFLGAFYKWKAIKSTKNMWKPKKAVQ